MKTLLIIFSLILFLNGFGQASPLYGSVFYRLNQTDIKVKSSFSGSANSCFHTQYRFESISNDTVFLRILFNARMPVSTDFCSRFDTISVTQNIEDCSYIYISTGVVRYGEFETSPPDTIWDVYDSTFNAQLGIPDFGSSSGLSWNISNNELKVISDVPVQSVELFDLNGKAMLYTREDHLNIEFLETGIYIFRVLTGSGASKTIRWYRP